MFRSMVPSAVGIVGALIAFPAMGQLQGGEEENCSPLSCTGVSVAPFVRPSDFALVPDHRPLIMITTWNGFYDDNDIGVHPSWYDDDVTNPAGPPTDVKDADGNAGANGVPDVFDWLLRQFDAAYDFGYRRIVMRLPAGSIQGQAMASSQWWTMPEWKRDGFETIVQGWLDEKALAGDPVDLGVYAGYRIDDPCSLDMSNARDPDPTSLQDMCVLYRNVKPWMDAGITECWFDTAGAPQRVNDMVSLQHSPDYAGMIRFGGEAIPHDIPPGGSSCDLLRTPTASVVEDSPFTANYSVVASRFGFRDVVDETKNELCVMLTGHRLPCSTNKGDRWEFDDAQKLHDVGWVLWTDTLAEHSSWITHTYDDGSSDSYSFDYTFRYGIEAVKRLYDYGQLTALVDFNNDGLIEIDGYDDPDMAAFFDAWLANTGSPGTYLEGDVNGDGSVDALDVSAFFNAANAWTANGTLIGVDLGPAWWMP